MDVKHAYVCVFVRCRMHSVVTAPTAAAGLTGVEQWHTHSR